MANEATQILTDKEIFIAGITVLGTILGAGFTLISVHMTNRSNQRTIREQLQHETVLRRQEYEMNLRRDVYLGLAEVVGAQLDLISKLNHFDKSNPELFERVLSLSGNAAKVHVIAGTDVLRELALLNQAYSEAQHQLMAERNRISEVYKRVQGQKAQASAHAQKVDHYIGLMAEFNLAGELSGNKETVVNRIVDHHLKSKQTHEDLATANSNEFNEELVRFTVRCDGERLRITTMLGPLVSAVRKELGLEINTDEYRKLHEIANPYTIEKVRNLFNIPAKEQKTEG